MQRCWSGQSRRWTSTKHVKGFFTHPPCTYTVSPGLLFFNFMESTRSWILLIWIHFYFTSYVQEDKIAFAHCWYCLFHFWLSNVKVKNRPCLKAWGKTDLISTELASKSWKSAQIYLLESRNLPLKNLWLKVPVAFGKGCGLGRSQHWTSAVRIPTLSNCYLNYDRDPSARLKCFATAFVVVQNLNYFCDQL